MPRTLSSCKPTFTESTASGGGFEWRVAESRSGFIEAHVAADGAAQAFAAESGGHRFQRIPPTEKRGRVHTSTITVSVIGLCRDRAPSSGGDASRAAEAHRTTPRLDPAYLTLERFSAGKGGQNQNKHPKNVRAVYNAPGVPKMTVQVLGRHYHKNKDQAMSQMHAKFNAWVAAERSEATAAEVKSQVGTGMRGDKRRTIALQRDQVTDHVDGWTTTAVKYLRGDF